MDEYGQRQASNANDNRINIYIQDMWTHMRFYFLFNKKNESKESK